MNNIQKVLFAITLGSVLVSRGLELMKVMRVPDYVPLIPLGVFILYTLYELRNPKITGPFLLFLALMAPELLQVSLYLPELGITKMISKVTFGVGALGFGGMSAMQALKEKDQEISKYIIIVGLGVILQGALGIASIWVQNNFVMNGEFLNYVYIGAVGTALLNDLMPPKGVFHMFMVLVLSALILLLNNGLDILI